MDHHSSPQRPERPVGDARPVGEGIHAWVSASGGWGESNTVLITGHGASLLVDTLWDLPRTAAMLAAFGPHLDTAPISRVVNTHADGDHWFGNQLTGAAEIIATKTAARHMGRDAVRKMKSLRGVCALFRAMSYAPVPKRSSWRVTADYFEAMLRPFDFSEIRPRRPNSTFSGKMQLDVGGRHVLLTEVGPAHTSGDLVVHLPEERILAAGDVLFAGTIPILWDGSARNWTHACERILAWKVDTVIPGHGPVCDLSAVDMLRRYWQFLRAAVQRHYDKGHPPYTAALRIATSEQYLEQPFATWEGQERNVINVHTIYRRLMGRSRSLNTLDRLMLLREAALMARDLPQRAGAFSSVKA